MKAANEFSVRRNLYVFCTLRVDLAFEANLLQTVQIELQVQTKKKFNLNNYR